MKWWPTSRRLHRSVNLQCLHSLGDISLVEEYVLLRTFGWRNRGAPFVRVAGQNTNAASDQHRQFQPPRSRFVLWPETRQRVRQGHLPSSCHWAEFKLACSGACLTNLCHGSTERPGRLRASAATAITPPQPITDHLPGQLRGSVSCVHVCYAN